MIREISTVELVDGGSVIRQGEFFRLGYLPRDANGEPVNLVNKDITVAIMKRGQIVYEKDVEFDPGDGLIHLVVNENIGNGRMWLEFTATDPNFPTYRRKFPSRQETAVLDIVPGAEDLDFVGVSGMTVEKLQAEQASRQQAFEAEIVPQVEEFKQRVEDGIGAFTEDTEVLDARMGEQNLRAFNQKVTTKLADKATKEDLQEVENQVVVNSDFIVKEPFEGTASKVHEFTQLMDGFVISNEANDPNLFETNLLDVNYWQQGTLASADGTEQYNALRIRTKDFHQIEGNRQYEFALAYESGNYSFIVIQYNAEFGFLNATSWLSSPYSFTSLPTAKHTRFIVRNNDLPITPASAFRDLNYIVLELKKDFRNTSLKIAEYFPHTPVNEADWEIGSLAAATGLPTSSTLRIRTKNFLPVNVAKKRKLEWASSANDYTFTVYEYDQNQNFIKSSGWKPNPYHFADDVNTKFYKFIMQKNNGATITAAGAFSELQHIRLTSNPITVKSGEVFSLRMLPFKYIYIESGVPYRAYGLGVE